MFLRKGVACKVAANFQKPFHQKTSYGLLLISAKKVSFGKIYKITLEKRKLNWLSFMSLLELVMVRVFKGILNSFTTKSTNQLKFKKHGTDSTMKNQ